MSEDSLANEEEEENNQQPSSTTTTTVSNQLQKNSQLKSPINNPNRSNTNHDEHIKLVIQKKQEADVIRLQKFQEQLRKKEQKWYVIIHNNKSFRFFFLLLTSNMSVNRMILIFQ